MKHRPLNIGLPTLLLLATCLAAAGNNQATPATEGSAQRPAVDDRHAPGVALDYLGQTPPARAAEVFAPGIISIPRDEGGFAERPVFSPDYRECFFDVTNYKTKTFTSCSMRCENGVWSKPEPAFFTRFGGVQASIAADGGTLFFSGPSPTDAKIRGIWMARRESNGWANPVFLDPPVNTSAGAGFPCVVRGGALYFGVFSGSDRGLHRARMVDGRFSAVDKVAALQPRPDCIFGDFFVAPDESFIVIYSTLPGNLGNGDLYVSFRRANDSWTEPRNLGPEVNTKRYDFAPSLSPDGRYLFFTRDEGGTGRVYWISTAAFGAPGPGALDAGVPNAIAEHQPQNP
jgi:hypothetical protein